MKPYNFVQETAMCAAGLTAYESPATNQGTLMDVLKKEKKHKKTKKHKRISLPNPYSK